MQVLYYLYDLYVAERNLQNNFKTLWQNKLSEDGLLVAKLFITEEMFSTNSQTKPISFI